MQQDWAVKRMLATLKKDADIPFESLEHIGYALELMWQVGYEAGWKEGRKALSMSFNKLKTPVKQLDKDRNVIKEHISVIAAAIELECSSSCIFEALRYGYLTKQGHYWERVPIEEPTKDSTELSEPDKSTSHLE